MSERPVNPKPESLDDIIGRRAVVLADQIQKAAAWAKSEMDLQIEVAGALKEFAREAKIKLDGHHNITIATGHRDELGRPDSVYSNVIVEYKDPGTLSGNRDGANNKKLIEQIRSRFYAMRREENRPMNSMFGVGTDGKYFVFVRFRDEKWTDEEPLEVNRHSTERFLWALYNLGQRENRTNRNTCTEISVRTAQSRKKACVRYMKRSLEQTTRRRRFFSANGRFYLEKCAGMTSRIFRTS